MNIIIFEDTEKTPHTFKFDLNMLKTHPELKTWKRVVINRCKRCNNLFASKTDRKYCSYQCRYKKHNGLSKEEWKCSYPLCKKTIKDDESFIMERDIKGRPKVWHPKCYETYQRIMPDKTDRPYEISKDRKAIYYTNKEEIKKLEEINK